MASSKFKTEQYFSESFVESAGAVLFRLSTREICLIRLLVNKKYILPKGRRNIAESRQTAAIREVAEETGYSCRILPVKMLTRNPPAVETEPMADESRLHDHACEPFTLQIRHLAEDDVKIIWWFIAAINEETNFNADAQEDDKFTVEFFDMQEAITKLTFKNDQEMVQKAVEIFLQTHPE
ncbi:hypothetical protein BT63DRAFT_264271 [Microthyrium microscopicum]|uniref:Nudix hydrolase domain-containing protein n=1 Tax=Microthyrium microscopicum TaxID=703497 RepID=A0A6A6UEN9_9PEZI|nr:hypothetical protein BT63DRAFT_264271 [Microthyrium microscopicum]